MINDVTLAAFQEARALKHLVIALTGLHCTCSDCAPTATIKAEREALNAVRKGGLR